MNSAESFSSDFQAARSRSKLRKTPAHASIQFPTLNAGPDGESLATDVAFIGPSTAEATLVMISATHGVEGFCGSGAQVDWLRREEYRLLPEGIAVLMIHAINPYGFAWLRRVTHENVDLNRNWVDFNRPRPRNPAYEALAENLCPQDWSNETRIQTGASLKAYNDEQGERALQQAVSGGQYSHPRGLFYGGDQATWSRRTQSALFDHYLRASQRIAILDYHTGLGPWALGLGPWASRPWRTHCGGSTGLAGVQERRGVVWQCCHLAHYGRAIDLCANPR